MTKEVPRTSVLRDEELSISDATLIARLQNSKGWPTLGNAAADRIEALIAERDAAEAKLAKAAGALLLCAGHDHDCVSKIQIARTTIAEIKSHSDEFATQKGESRE